MRLRDGITKYWMLNEWILNMQIYVGESHMMIYEVNASLKEILLNTFSLQSLNKFFDHMHVKVQDLLMVNKCFFLCELSELTWWSLGSLSFMPHNNILDKTVLPVLCQYFMLSLFLCQHDTAPLQCCCTESWPQPHPTPLRWTGTPTASQTLSPNISSRPHLWFSGWMGVREFRCMLHLNDLWISGAKDK